MDRNELRKLLQQITQNPEMKIESVQLIDEGTGFISDVFRVTTSDSNDSAKIPRKFVMKTPALIKGRADESFYGQKENDQNMLTKSQIITKVHNNECLSYTLFDQYSDQFPNVNVPKVYALGAKSEGNPGYILMEDLVDAGYKMVDFQTGLDSETIYRLVDSIIDIHIFSFQNPDIVQALEPFPLFAYEWFPFQGSKIVKSLEEHKFYKIPRSKVNKVFNFDVIEAMSNFQGPKVLVHGSLWSNNLFVQNTVGNSPNPVIIDWQLAHKGSPSEDISRLLTSALSPEMRRNCESDITDYYLSELRSRCEKLSIDVPFSDAEFLQWYMKDFQFSANMLLGQTGMLLMHDEKKKDNTFDRNQLLVRAIAACTDALNVV